MNGLRVERSGIAVGVVKTIVVCVVVCGGRKSGESGSSEKEG